MATYYVRKSGDDANGGTDPDTDAKLTIASAYSASTTDDTIDIGVGTWSEDLNPVGRLYVGAGMFNTVIDGTIYATANTGTCSFTDMRINWNQDRSWYSSASIQWNITLTRVYFDFTTNFGGLYSYSLLNVTVTNCVFYAPNTSSGSNWITCAGNGTAVITNSLFYGNSSNSPRLALTGFYTSTTFVNNILLTCRIFWNSAYTIDRRNNCLYNVSYDIDLIGTDGNIYTDPLFVDAAGGDFRLTEDSPCIGAGTGSI